MDPKSEMPPLIIWRASRACLNLLESCLLRSPADAIAELKSAERRLWVWANILRVFSENASLDAQLHAAKREGIRELYINLLCVLNHNLLLALKFVSSGREVESIMEGLKAPLFIIRESLDRLENLIDLTIHAMYGSLIPRTIIFAAKHDDFEVVSSLFSIVIFSQYALPIPKKEKMLAPFPEGLSLALAKSSVVRYFRILYERHQRDRGIQEEVPVMPMLAQNVCDPAEEDMNDSPTTSEAALCHRAPKIPEGQKTGTCPICKQVLPAEEFKSPNWIPHVMKDIQPYVCLSRDCLGYLKFFERRQDWIHHMHKYHTTSWICNLHNTYVWRCSICELMSLAEFVSEEALEKSFFWHLQEVHPNIEQSTRSRLLYCDSMPQPRSSESCPICGTLHPAQAIPHGEDKTRATDISSQTQASDNPGVENCIAEHLLELAFISMNLLMAEDR